MRFIPARLRDATVLLRPGKDLYDISDLGVNLERLIRSRDSSRIVAVGDRRVAVFEAKTGKRLAQIDNDGVDWLGYSLEAPSGLIIITGAVMGPTNGSVWPQVLSVSADGTTAQSKAIQTRGFGGAVGVTPNCDAMTVADDPAPNDWHIQKFELNVDRLGEPTDVERPPTTSASPSSDGITALAPYGPAFESGDVFVGQAKRNPFLATRCSELARDDGFVPGGSRTQGVRVIPLEPVLAFEQKERWTNTTTGDKPQPSTYVPNCTQAQPCPIIAGRTQDTFARDEMPITDSDQVGPPPATRWSRRDDARDPPLYFDHRVFNSGHQLAICRNDGQKDVCFVDTRLGEDQLDLPFLRSPDGRYLFWPFGGSLFDLQTLQPMTAMGAIPTTPGIHYDFDVDRPAFTVAVEGRLVSFLANDKGTAWERSGEERGSPIFGALSSEGGDKTLHTLASLGGRQYLAVRGDGVLARLDGVSGREVWRVSAVGLGAIQGAELNPERRHVLLMGKTAWRLFRLSDGLALSGLLAPPPGLDQTSKLEACRVQDVLGPGGELIATCGDRSFAWRPRPFTGDIERQLTRLTCASELGKSALETIRRCYVTRRVN